MAPSNVFIVINMIQHSTNSLIYWHPYYSALRIGLWNFSPNHLLKTANVYGWLCGYILQRDFAIKRNADQIISNYSILFSYLSQTVILYWKNAKIFIKKNVNLTIILNGVIRSLCMKHYHYVLCTCTHRRLYELQCYTFVTFYDNIVEEDGFIWSGMTP